MAEIKDAMALKTKAVIKRKHILSKENILEEHDCRIVGSVKSGVITFEIEDLKTAVSVSLHDVMVVMQESNKAFIKQKGKKDDLSKVQT